MSQDAIVASFTTAATTSCNTLIAQFITFQTALGSAALQGLTLDEAHREQIYAVDKSSLMALRRLIDQFQPTLQQCIAAGTPI